MALEGLHDTDMRDTAHRIIDESVTRLSGFAAIVVGSTYLAAGITALLMPPELQAPPDVTPHEFWSVLSQKPFTHLAFH